MCSPTEDLYQLLAKHLSALGMGYPPGEGLEELLREGFSPGEVEIALALPTRVAPLQPVGLKAIARKVKIPQVKLRDLLEKMVQKGLLFTGKAEEGERGYALQQFGWGFPQSWFWGGKDTPYNRKIAGLFRRYQNRETLRQAFGGTATKAFRFVPVGETGHGHTHAVYPYHMMTELIAQTRVIAVAHCPCRMVARLKGSGCEHPLEVCLKYDELAEYLIETGRGREVSKEEAQGIIDRCEELGMVHLVDNAQEKVKHTCNCCSCACWSLNTLKKRKVPRDVLMATYFLRETDADKCTACGTCVEVCPVAVVSLNNGLPVVDREWCIGCGVCVMKCPSGAAVLTPRLDRIDQVPRNFAEQQAKILREKGLA